MAAVRGIEPRLLEVAQALELPFAERMLKINLPGARGRYVDGEWGLRVNVLVEEVLDSEPDPAAFFDPDEKGTTL